MTQMRYQDQRGSNRPLTAMNVSKRQAVSFAAKQSSHSSTGFVLADNRPSTVQLRQKMAIQAQNMPVQRNQTGLPDNLKSGMEKLSGINLDHINVHYNSPKPAALQAHAYAQGSDIHLASGQEQHLPHELGHVVQQAQGRVKATTQVAGQAVNDNAALESEATQMGARALRDG